MPEINVREFRRTLEDTFRRYLFTLNFLPDNERDLREAFRNALLGRTVFSRDPLLSVIPAYKPDSSVTELIARSKAPRLHPALARLATGGFDPDRALYEHQVRSIEKIQEGRNLVVASGTGSGKTECFLLPVLDDALRNPGPGVRAIVVYPLNALANDQLGRLRRLLEALPDISFGRYTGDTPWKRQDATEDAPPNERLSREEIRANPPHVLLTNFAMLEYLLLRPQDSDVFAQQRLQFVVLDEAHSYSGAQGIDVSLLMRRLRQAFPKRQVQFVLTSATMGRDKGEIAQFGTTLTGGEYVADDVLFGSTVSGFDSELDDPIPLSQYVRAVPDGAALSDWLQAIGNRDSLLRKLSLSGLAAPIREVTYDTAGAVLSDWFRRNRELEQLHGLASREALTIEELSQRMWGNTGSDALTVTEWLLALGANAVSDPTTSAPLLPARYHFFFRGLQGASVCISPECPEHAAHPNTFWSNLVLDQQPDCPQCGAGMFPLLTCFHCGTPYLRVAEVDGKWQAITPGMGADVHILTWTPDTEEVDDESEGEEAEVSHPAVVCLMCRNIEVGGQLPFVCCEHPIQRTLRVVLTERADGVLSRCPICAGRSQPFPTVLRGFATGEDAATAVLAESVVRMLPSEIEGKPADGRRLLCFSDSRQRAAYFASYLARTTADSQYMQPLFRAVEVADQRSNGQGASFNEVAEIFWEGLQEQKYVVIRSPIGDGEYKTAIKPARKLLGTDEREIRRECLIALFQHFTASPRNRQNLPGLALAHLKVAWNREDRETLPQRLPWLFQNGWTSGEPVLQWLLRVFAWRRTLTFPEGIRLQLIGAGPKSATFHASTRGTREGRQIHRWNPYGAEVMRDLVIGRSPQAEILAKFFGVDKQAAADRISDALCDTWGVFRDLGILEQTYPNEFQLPWNRLLIGTTAEWYACGRCGLLTAYPVAGACVMPGCGGSLKRIDRQMLAERSAEHHWYARYTSVPSLPLEVKEHTAQLTNECGSRYQRLFNDRDINVLSCSTTFEMGVDVGTLKAIFLRNVPPTPANYIQRAGRAGRRLEGAAFAITYARSTPHDQTHFFAARDIVHGEVPVPRISLSNRKLTQRHVNSFLLGSFLKSTEAGITDDRISVGTFFLEPTPATSAAARFGPWIEAQRGKLVPALRNIIDPASNLDPASSLLQSRTELHSARAMLLDRLDGFEKQKADAETQLQNALGRERYAALRNIESAERLIQELRSKERLIDFLASEPHWLPSYAFPQDVARLLVRQENLSETLRLERDLEYAIAEYAPGSEVIADGRLLVSGGVDLQSRELDVRAYRICPVCNRVDRAAQRSEIPRQCPTCGVPPTGPRSRPMTYIIPRGFTTLIDDPVADVRLYRLRPPPNSEVFLVEGAQRDQFFAHPSMRGITLGHCPNGTLFRANSGPKGGHFSVCRICGNAKPGNGPHQKPWGPECRGGRVLTDLVCEFETDTLQIRFDGVTPAVPSVTDRTFWLSLQTAFIASAADALVIPSRDLDGTYRRQGEGSMAGELIVYDRVPGGAGYVERIRQELPKILRKTLDRVLTCPSPTCELSGGCYACLRTFGNQFSWDLLRRDAVVQWLQPVLESVATARQGDR